MRGRRLIVLNLVEEEGLLSTRSRSSPRQELNDQTHDAPREHCLERTNDSRHDEINKGLAHEISSGGDEPTSYAPFNLGG